MRISLIALILIGLAGCDDPRAYTSNDTEDNLYNLKPICLEGTSYWHWTDHQGRAWIELRRHGGKDVACK